MLNTFSPPEKPMNSYKLISDDAHHQASIHSI